MNPDSARTQLTPPPALDDGATIALSPQLPPRLDEAATVHDASLGADSAPETAAPDASRVRYAILGLAGRGGMATVHVARDLELMRKVALKQLADELRGATPARLRFLREVQITAQLDHPHIVPVYGLEVGPGGAPAYAMKLVEGHTLGDLLREAREAYADGGRPDERHGLATRLEHFLKVCDAVDYAHGKGVIHRDLKPANVMIGPHREVYVMDWGICRLFGQDDPEFVAAAALADHSGGHQTEIGSVVGTPRYMSPEQAQGRSDLLGPRSDQCALGLMLFELVTLRAPLEGDSALQVLEHAAQARRAAFVHGFERAAIPRPLRAIVERATHYDPAQRYPSVAALADDLRRYLRGEAVQALPDSLWQRAQRFVGRHRQGVLLSLLGVVALASLGFAALIWRHEQAALVEQAQERAQRALLDEVAREGDQLQLALLQLQGELDALAVAAVQLLEHAQPAASGGMYWREDFFSAERRPPDLGTVPGFPQPVSLDFGVWSEAPGVVRAEVLPLALRLHHLRTYRNQLFALVRSNPELGDYRSGVVELRLVLAAGLGLHYPGHALERHDDPRSEAWYQRVTGEQDVRWGEPFVDAETGTLLLPLATALRDPEGRVLGAISIDLALQHVIANLLRDDAKDSDQRVLLLDDEGRVLASQQVLDERPADAAGRVALAPFGDAALRTALRADELGVLPTQAFGRDEWIAFDRIHPLDWVLVRVAPAPNVD